MKKWTRFISDLDTRTKIVITIFLDILAVLFAAFFALLIKTDGNIHFYSNEELTNYVWASIVCIIATIVILTFAKLYRSVWAYVGIHELVLVIISSLLVLFIHYLTLKLLYSAFSLSYSIIFGIILFIFLVIIRFSYRFIRDMSNRKGSVTNCINLMIVGAGDAGNIIIKELLESNSTRYNIRCVIDDDKNKENRFVQGIKIVGQRDYIKEAVEKYAIDEILIAIPSASRNTIKDIISICNETKCTLRTLPGLYQLANGDVSVSDIKDVEIEDLLGREPINIDLESILGYVQNKVIMVTGGGGSIGSELCRQLASHNPKKLIIVEISENSAYDIQQELIRHFPKLDLIVLIASVRDEKRLNSIFEKYRPDIVYHAAAHKHVPLMEDSPNEAIKNNVLGTYKTAKAAGENGCSRFVLISTDKAVNPTNIMGASKRICEMIVQTLNNEYSTEFVAVRFGNVLGSNGSVIPLFKKQIAEGGPVTVTHPDIIRYFMTIPEAVSLVLQAGALAKGGEIFVLDMGNPVKILDLAKNLIRLSGYKVDEDIQIVFTGLRPGEKLYEELLMSEEGLENTQNKLIYIGKPISVCRDELFAFLNSVEKVFDDKDKDIKNEVKKIVTTYQNENKLKD